MAESIHKGPNQELEGPSGRSRAHRFSRIILTAAAASFALGCQSLLQSEPPPRRAPAAAGPSALATTESQIIDLINRQRAQASVAPLARNRALDSAARHHARNMARLKTMSHVLPGTDAPALPDRIRMVRYVYTRVAENIAYGQHNANEVVSGWMGSTGHRESILDSRLTETGVGIARGPNGGLYFCQVFGRPR